MIQHFETSIHRNELGNIGRLTRVMEERYGEQLLRWYIADITPDSILVEGILDLAGTMTTKTERDWVPSNGTAVVSLIPTGIGCSIGGYAGDAAPVSALLAATTDHLITNPNAVNASNFIYTTPNLVYTEGYLMDQFCQGRTPLYVSTINKIGLIINRPDEGRVEQVYNIVNMVRAVYGIPVTDIEFTDEPMGPHILTTASGVYTGSITNFNTLGRACERLLARGVNAIAVTSDIGGINAENYAAHFEGGHPNPIGGTEAVISHWIGRHFRVPAAHGPLNNFKLPTTGATVVDARSAGEYISQSGLACVLIGLRNAPQMDARKCMGIKGVITPTSLLAVVCPANALGGVPVLAAIAARIPVIAVKENRTILQIDSKKLDEVGIIEVRNYTEAAGTILALRCGIGLETIRRPIRSIGSDQTRTVAFEERTVL